MKKMFMLILVLALAPLASAAVMDEIALSYSGGVVTITGLTTDIGAMCYGGVYVSAADDALATVTNTVNSYAAAGDLRALSPPSVTLFNGVDILAQKSSEGTLSTGTWFDFGLITSLGTVTFDIYDYEVSYETPAGQMEVTIPEPVTMALLGLGGLFLRRKK